MSVRGDRPLEIAMTHRVGAGGLREVCLRPAPVREMAQRLRKWSGSPETCQSCSSLPAVSVCDEEALCGRCRSQRHERRYQQPYVARPRFQARAEDSQTALVGMAIVFDSRSVDLGGFTEFVRQSFVDRTLSERVDLRALWNHNSDLTIGRSTAGTLELWKGSRGLMADIRPPKWAHAYVESVDRRDVTGMSFAFETLDDDWHLENGEPVRELFDGRVYEVSGVSFPAYPATTLRVQNPEARMLEAQTALRVRMAR